MTHPYATRKYAEITAGPNDIVAELPEWNQFLIHRSLSCFSNNSGVDASGCYPVTPFDETVDLDAGLESLRAEGCVSVVLVVDPVSRPSDGQLADSFDVCRPFKTHYLYNRRKSDARYSKHHRYELRRARAEVEKIDLSDYLDDWVRLYQGLILRHGITGAAAFSDKALCATAAIEELVTFGAFVGDRMVGCHLWFRDGDSVHSHLAVSDATGRNSGSAYLLYDKAIRYFDQAETIDFGGAAGLDDDPHNGLARFKRGFSNETAPSYLCGKILDRQRYAQLCLDEGVTEGSDYFPAYRTPAQLTAARVR